MRTLGKNVIFYYIKNTSFIMNTSKMNTPQILKQYYESTYQYEHFDV